MAILHIGHFWGGGLNRWVNDFMQADSEENYFLCPEGSREVYGLKHRLLDKHLNCISEYSPLNPIARVAMGSPELQQWVQTIVKDRKIKAMIFSSPFGISLDLLKIPDVKKLVVIHDASTVCAGAFGYFDLPCEKCDNSDLKRCLETNPAAILYRGLSPEFFDKFRKTFVSLTSDLPFVAPTKASIDRIIKIEPFLANHKFHIIEHGIDVDFQDCFGGAKEESKLRFVHIGVSQWYKGWPFVGEVLKEFSEQVDFYFLGCGPAEKSLKTWSKLALPEYDYKDLPRILESISPDLGILFSIVPETYSYTFTELSHAHIPILATNLGAFAERLLPTNGFLVAPNGESLKKQIKIILQNKKLLRDAHSSMKTLNKKTAHQMVQEYKKLLSTEK